MRISDENELLRSAGENEEKLKLNISAPFRPNVLPPARKNGQTRFFLFTDFIL
jgi:hypothetical protein